MLPISKILFPACLMLMIGCSNTPSEETKDETQAPVTGETQASLSGLNNENFTDSGSQQAPSSPVIINSVTPVPGSMQKPPAVAPPTGAGMNPPHGQPGHRCEIAVGAPLNSAPAPTPPPSGAPSTPPPQVTSPGSGNLQMTPMPSGLIVPGSTPATPAPASTVKTAPGMNPPHGEPGHDCSIAVGAPLKK